MFLSVTQSLFWQAHWQAAAVLMQAVRLRARKPRQLLMEAARMQEARMQEARMQEATQQRQAATKERLLTFTVLTTSFARVLRLFIRKLKTHPMTAPYLP